MSLHSGSSSSSSSAKGLKAPQAPIRVLLATFGGFAGLDSSISPILFLSGKGQVADLPDSGMPVLFYEVANYATGSWWVPVCPVPPDEVSSGKWEKLIKWGFATGSGCVPTGHQLRPLNLFWWVERPDVADGATPLSVAGGLKGSFPTFGLPAKKTNGMR